MNKQQKTPTWVTKSPWLDTSKPNLFRDEFQLAEEKLPDAYFTPLEPYRWIYNHNGQELFFKGLAQYAPMFPLYGYQGQVAVWTSPPPSGAGNAIYIIMGHDKKGVLRLVGGNYFNEPTPSPSWPAATTDFFTQLDSADHHGKKQLVRKTVQMSIGHDDQELLTNIRRECEHFHTMPIYLTILGAEGCMFHAAKAVIEGRKTADFSYEYFGEIL
jgi:hypothetical protein